MKLFLTAEWRYLLMLNYAVRPGLLERYVPAGTELDAYDGRTFISIVGFLFADTRVLGFAIPFHRTFEEVNLRFYVRRDMGDEIRRGVVFIREIVPRVAIAAAARLLYNEPYVAMPMQHAISTGGDNGSRGSVEYSWRSGRVHGRMYGEFGGEPRIAEPGSAEEFITEHFRGYTTRRDGGTREYRVEHSSWRLWNADAVRLDADLSALYGPAIADAMRGPCDSAFIADGSPVRVYMGESL